MHCLGGSNHLQIINPGRSSYVFHVFFFLCCFSMVFSRFYPTFHVFPWLFCPSWVTRKAPPCQVWRPHLPSPLGVFFPDDKPVEFQSGPRKNASEKSHIFIASYSITDISLTYQVTHHWHITDISLTHHWHIKWHIIHEWSRLDHHPAAPAWSRQLPSNHPEWTNWRELAPQRNPCSWRSALGVALKIAWIFHK